ncbi:MAG: Fic family protein [bacterium]
MKSLDIEFLNRQAIPIELSGLLQKLGEFKGRQDLFQCQTPQVLETLKQTAIIESTESSNRIEGVSIPKERFRELMAHPEKPQNRSEAEILGYIEVLSRIHTQPEDFNIDEATIRKFHKQIYAKTNIRGGEWKKKDNTIEERLPDGQWITRFVPVSAAETPYYMKELCSRFNRLWNSSQIISPLLLIPAFVFDFLCIHPFTDGNGRISRLLNVLLLHQADYTVGKYISIERLIEQSKETYYEVLMKSSQNWHDGRHSLKAWWEYSLGILISAYRNLEKRLEEITKLHGAKTGIVQEVINNLPSRFSMGDVIKSCPGVSRPMLRVVLENMRRQGKIELLCAGRNAMWQKCDNKTNKCDNKCDNS